MDSANTFNMYISGIKLFFEDFVKKPEIIKGIKWKRDKGIGKLPAELIMPEEFEKMTKKCVNPRDRALLNVMYDTGCRVGEAISLDIKHIQEDEGNCIQQVCYSTFHDCLTQVCFGCKKIRSSIKVKL